MKIFLVIPVYNEEKTIKKVVKKASVFIKNIITVNDNSTDETKNILRKLPVRLINNDKNLGYAKTLELGLKFAFKYGADYAITFDADDQHQAEDIKRFISLINRVKPDLILGKRSFKNRFMEDIFGIYSKIRFDFSDPLCGMKAYKKEVFEKYGYLEKKYTIATELTFKAVKDCAKFVELPIHSQKRKSEPRFAGSLKGNLLELIAFINILFI